MAEVCNSNNAINRPMNSEDYLLISQLGAMNPIFASFVNVIIHASETMTKGSDKNDFDHSEAVYQRLSEILPNAQRFGLSAAEIFILIAGAYLHDIGYPHTTKNKRHGAVAADMVINNDSLKSIFPAVDIQNQVARVCDYHDREIADLKELAEEVKLDVRPCRCFTGGRMAIRPRMLSAIFRLADELECNSDRMLIQSDDDPRNIISAVRIDLESRYICLDFKYGTTHEKCDKCVEYLRSKVEMLGTFLNSYGLSFEVVDKLPEKGLMTEEKRVGSPLDTFDYSEEVSEPSITVQKNYNIGHLIEMYEKGRMARIDSVMSLLSERSEKK